MTKLEPQREPHSTNPLAAKIAGKRGKGEPLMMPWEMDYNCPVCHQHCSLCEGSRSHGDNFDDSLCFSEYNYFMWCPKCNIDIPSMLCLRANTKEKVRWYTERFLDMLTKAKEKKS